MSVVEQVAEARCRPECDCVESCCTVECNRGCQGTGLRWPELSRKCPWTHYPESGCKGSPGIDMGKPRTKCDGSGRVPDVTLEKVLLLLPEGKWMLSYHFGPCVELPGEVECRGETYLEAACAALIASV